MRDKNLDTDGYLTYTEKDSPLRQAVAKALRELDLHSNGNDSLYSNDLIYGQSGLDRWPQYALMNGYYAYTELAVFLFVKGFLRLLINTEKDDGEIESKIIFPEPSRASFKQKMSNIDGPQFSKEIERTLSGANLKVVPVRGKESLYKNILFSVPANNPELFLSKGEYYLKGNDILFDKDYDPFI